MNQTSPPLTYPAVNALKALHTRKTFLDFHIGVYQPCPDLKRTLVAMSERTGLSISQVTDEVLYTGLVEMQELPEFME